MISSSIVTEGCRRSYPLYIAWLARMGSRQPAHASRILGTLQNKNWNPTMNMNVFIGLCLLIAMSPTWAEKNITPSVDLPWFYQSTQRLYSHLKNNTNNFMSKKLSANEYVAKMREWRSDYQKLDPMAPCPKNHWHRYYKKLTSAHYSMCFAWSDLNAVYTSLLVTRSPKDVVYFETEFRKEMRESQRDIQHPASDTLRW